jgi:hypothetical protein
MSNYVMLALLFCAVALIVVNATKTKIIVVLLVFLAGFYFYAAAGLQIMRWVGDVFGPGPGGH